MLLGVMTFSVSAAGEPKVKIIATETETEVNVSVKVAGNVSLEAFDVSVGYKTDKLALKAPATVIQPTGWTLMEQNNRTVYQSATDSFVQMANGWNKIGGSGSAITIVDGTDYEVASFTFTKNAAITASDIYYSAAGFRYSLVGTSHTSIFNGTTEITAKDTPGLVETTVTLLGGTATPTGNENISASISTASPNVVFSTDNIVSFDLNVEKFADVKNFMVDFSYDPAKLILQNSEADDDVYVLDDDGSGNVRMIVTLPAKRSSTAAVKLYTLNFKMKEAAKDTNTTVTLKKFVAGIAVDDGVEVTSAIGTAAAAININDYVFSYDINGDGKIDMGDLVYAEGFYGAKEGDANWNTAKKADADGDGRITVGDFIKIAIHIATHK